MKKLITTFIFTIFFLVTNANGQEREPVEIKRTDLGNGIYMLEGAGGNVGVSVGEDGVFIIDDQFDYMSESILKSIREITDQPLEYVFNTHWHGDHVGGNEKMHQAGGTIVAHDNVRARLKAGSTEGRVVAPAKPDALPTITFSEEMSLHLNGNDIRVLYVGNAHTDGDALVHFTDLNILHTGDTMLRDRYPFIDINSGGAALGYTANLKNILAMSDEKTKVIPGHGALSTKADVQALYGMMVNIQATVQAMIDDEKSDADIVKALTFPEYKDLEWRLGSAEKMVTQMLVELR